MERGDKHFSWLQISALPKEPVAYIVESLGSAEICNQEKCLSVEAIPAGAVGNEGNTWRAAPVFAWSGGMMCVLGKRREEGGEDEGKEGA